jgi:hypothetical protein
VRLRLRVLLIVVGALALAGCRLDVTVDVAMEPGGTGTVTVVALADAELVQQVPDLVDDLRLDDAVANGWVVGTPAPQAGGGVSITLTHPFSSDDELASVLNSIGPPLSGMAAARTVETDADGEPNGRTTNAIDGAMVLPNGFASFADDALVQAVGGQPFEAELTASGLTPTQAMSFTFRVDLPGELVSSTGTDIGDGTIEWTAPLDGTSVSLLTQTVQQPASAGNGWARPLSTVSFTLLLVWVVVAAAFIAFVAIARRSKRLRRERALRHLQR